MILKVERNIKTRKLYNVRMHFSLICCQKCARQCSNNDLLPANSILLRQKISQYSLFDWLELGFVRAKKYLAGHHDRQPVVRYLQPWYGRPELLFNLTSTTLCALFFDFYRRPDSLMNSLCFFSLLFPLMFSLIVFRGK